MRALRVVSGFEHLGAASVWRTAWRQHQGAAVPGQPAFDVCGSTKKPQCQDGSASACVVQCSTRNARLAVVCMCAMLCVRWRVCVRVGACAFVSVFMLRIRFCNFITTHGFTDAIA